MSSTEALIAAVIVAAVGTVATYVIALLGRVVNVVLLAARVWRLAVRHPRAPTKRFPWGSMLSLVLGGAVFWTSMAIAVVFVAEAGLVLAKQWAVKTPLLSVDPLGARWLLVYGLIFVGIVVTFTILSPLAWRQELRERDWKRTIRQGLHRLIAATTVPPERERDWKRAQRAAFEGMNEVPLREFVSRDLLKDFAATMTAKGYFCISASLLDHPAPKPSRWQRCARYFGRPRAARR
jgi:hypothetical protein